jgi:predicted metalloendopeptidase
MINNIRESFIEMLDENKWMSDEVRRKAEEKALLMDLRIGSPKELLEENKMDNFLGYVCVLLFNKQNTIFTKL